MVSHGPKVFARKVPRCSVLGTGTLMSSTKRPFRLRIVVVLHSGGAGVNDAYLSVDAHFLHDLFMFQIRLGNFAAPKAVLGFGRTLHRHLFFSARRHTHIRANAIWMKQYCPVCSPTDCPECDQRSVEYDPEPSLGCFQRISSTGFFVNTTSHQCVYIHTQDRSVTAVEVHSTPSTTAKRPIREFSTLPPSLSSAWPSDYVEITPPCLWNIGRLVWCPFLNEPLLCTDEFVQSSRGYLLEGGRHFIYFPSPGQYDTENHRRSPTDPCGLPRH